MLDLNILNSAKNQSSKNLEKITHDLDQDLNKGISLFNEFMNNSSEATLKKALKIFFSYIRHKKTNVEVFFYISFSAYLLGDKELAKTYLNYAKEISPDFPNLNHLKQLIFKV